MKPHLLLSVVLALFFLSNASAQTVVQGRITDVRTKEPLPFANVVFKGTSIGITSDFEGYYRLSSTQEHDSLVVSYIGYKRQAQAVRAGQTQTINFQLEEDAQSLQEVVIRPGKKKWEDPAYPIIRKVLENKSRNNKTSLLAYEYEVYNKVELSLQRIPEEAKKKKLLQQVQATYDSIYRYTSDEGETLLPVFLSESISKFYYRTKPQLRREHILHTNLRGFGVEDGSLLSQLVGASFQEYNFYENWLNILEKEFASPLADGWKLYYDYQLQDSLRLDGQLCYKIAVAPKREQDLAFWGTLWITKDEYALKQLDLQVLPAANINFVHKIAISQQLMPTEAGGWLPAKTRVMMDVRQPGQKGSGIVAKFYTSLKDAVVNQPHQPGFYANPITVETKASAKAPDFWEKNRHDSLSFQEAKIVQMIDSANQLPSVKRTIGLLKALGTGYVKWGSKLEIGPYPLFYTFNDLEGHRLGAGLRTTINFSSKYRLAGFVAYGTKDNRVKYSLQAEQILSRNSWTVLRLNHSSDIEQIGMNADELSGTDYIFYASSRWGTMRLPYHYQRTGLQLQSDVTRGITARLAFNHRYYSPIFAFGYRHSDDPNALSTEFRTSEVMLETRLAKGETFLINDFERLSAGTQGWPVLTLKYAYGVPLLGSDFEYHRVGLHATQLVKMAFLGVSRYKIEGGKYFGTLPYPLLEVHLGNESPFYTSAAYSLMNVAEFASDTYASVKYIHYFEGFLLNRIPLMKKLKWRAIAHGSLLWGHLSEANQQLVAPLDPETPNFVQPRSLGDAPYVEVGYGIENIFKFFRVDAFHRLTYLENPNARRFGVKVSMSLVL